MIAGTQSATEAAPSVDRKPRHIPLWHVVLHDDDEHTYEYVIEMLQHLFHYDRVGAYRMAEEVDSSGRVVVETCVYERAEFKRDQIRAYGRDWRVEQCCGSMTASLEAAGD